MAVQSAVLIVPPHSVQAFAAPLRRRFQPDTWMHIPAHITLLVPFAPPERLDDAVHRLEGALAKAPPFRVTLDHYGRFPKATFLEPREPQPILDLYRRLAAAFPEYPVYEGEYGRDLSPHLTLARFETESDVRAFTMPPAPTLTFTVDRLTVYTGSPDEPIPFVPQAVLPLRGRP
jgi:2'-5' RNA ligase